MKDIVFLLVSVVVLGLCLGQGTTPDPSKGKCPRLFPFMDYLRPKPCSTTKPYCPEGLICCPCSKSGKKFCVKPTFEDDVTVDPIALMGPEGEHYDCHEDDDDDDDKEETDRVFETDRLADMEEHKDRKRAHRIRCHHLRMHRIFRIALPIVGLLVIVAIIVIVACCIRRRRMKRAAQATKHAPYTTGNIAPVTGDKSVMKGFLGLDFSPEVFVSSEPPYKKLQDENARI